MRFLKVLIFFLFPLLLHSQAPITEVRAVWLTTNWGLDWPATATSQGAQKEALRRVLDQLQASHFNVVLFQARAQGRVCYQSKIEEKVPYFDYSNGFDPLAFAIEECHKRGMECHAWMVTYTMENIKFTKGKKRQIINDKPDYYKAVGNTWYLDPGRPESKHLVLSIATEIVSNYNVDGIHFDYVRYPSNTRQFPDEDTYQKYGNGEEDIYQWRRENISDLVYAIYDTVKALKKWVQVSSSPLGRYRVLPEVSKNDGWTAYETVFQDAGHWMKGGKHDLIFPMMYHKERYFYPYVDDWMANSNGRILVPGLGVFQMDEQKWTLEEITSQMQYARTERNLGQAYFRVGNIIGDLKGIKNVIRDFYPTPAKLPPLTWLDNDPPSPPRNVRTVQGDNGYLAIQWDIPDEKEEYSYNIYSSTTNTIDLDDPRTILATGIRSNSYSFPLPLIKSAQGLYYFVTTSDRFHNESQTALPAYFQNIDN